MIVVIAGNLNALDFVTVRTWEALVGVTDKPVTVRLAQSQLRELMGLSIVDNSNLADQIRQAVALYITNRLDAPDFQDQVESAKARQSSVLEALGRR